MKPRDGVATCTEILYLMNKIFFLCIPVEAQYKEFIIFLYMVNFYLVNNLHLV
jgi:hypothetical protein